MILFRSRSDGSIERCGAPAPFSPAGERIYAIGDVHGRLDLLAELVAAIKRDQKWRVNVPTRIILLGDLVDRGPAVAELVRMVMRCTRQSDRFVVLKGNHEAMMVDALDGDLAALDVWLQQGGRETLSSWGLSPAEIDSGASRKLVQRARKAVGVETLAWLAQLPVMAVSGDHAFVHAGIRPGVPLQRQQEDDLLWIRSEFLASDADHGVVVVHGHSVHDGEPDIQNNRIGIDTGAYRSDRLTAIGVEDGRTWFLATGLSGSAPARWQPDAVRSPAMAAGALS